MGCFEIIKRNGEKIQLNTREPFCVVKSATQNRSLMGDDNVQLSIVSSEILSFSKGDKIVIDGSEYYIRTNVNREVLSEDHFVYDATFYGVMYELMKSLYRNTDKDGKSTSHTFDLTYSIRDFVNVIINNVNRDYPGLWQFDESNCPDTEPRTISFSKNNCLQVLQKLCSDSEFKLEFLITQADGIRTIHIGKFGSKVVPPGGNKFFEWGKGLGLYNLKEQKVDDKAIITRLWVEGGTTNLRSDYRNYSERLQLPFPKRLNRNEHKLADGTVIHAGSEMIGIADDMERYLEDPDLRDMIGSDEDAKTYDNIFPRRTGTVTGLVDGDINAFIDDTMDFDLNETDENGTKYLIKGVSAKLTFTSGKLAGQEFELLAKGGYEPGSKKFTMIPFTDKRGLTIPTTDTDAYRVEVGDMYKITDINLPEAYELNAEEDLWYAAIEDFKPMTQARAQYQLTLDRMYFLETLPDDSDTCVFRVGDYVPVKDERLGIEKNIRIQKVSRNLLLEQDYTLTLSDITAISIQSQTVLEVKDHEIIIENNRLRDSVKARRGWRTTEELRTMVYDTDGYFDTENIRPNSIDTNMLTVGSKSQQFVLVDVVLQANVGGFGNRFNATSGKLVHLTIDANHVRTWYMGAGEFTMASNGGYYLFAKCSKKGSSGVWYLTQKPLKFEPIEDPNNYYFQVGILSSLYPDDKFRDFVTTYGFTRINGNTITTGRIVTSDGECYLDLDGNKFRIGDSSSSVDWNVTAKNRLSLHNVTLVSDSGDTSELGVFRGVYNANYIYYKGDEVLYTVRELCTYRYINSEPSRGNLPTNSVYWSIVAKGAPGDKGDSPVLVYRGVYSPNKTYYGTSQRVDAVKHNNIYYIANIDAGTIQNSSPASSSAVWNTFGTQFENIATGFLLAENANIANLIFRNQRLESNASTNGIPNFFLDGLKNIASFGAGSVVFDGASAKLGWLNVIGQELLGFDDDGKQRLRLTPNALPTVSSASASSDLVVKATGGDATYTGQTAYEVEFEQEVHCHFGQDDMDDDIELNLYAYVEFDIAEDSTLVDLSDIRFSCDVQAKGSSSYNHLNCSMSAYARRKVGSVWENIGGVSLNGSNSSKITIPKAGRIRISFYGSVNESVSYDCSGTFSMTAQSISAITAKTEMIIAKDGFMAIYNSNYMRMHSTDGLVVKFGNYYFRVDSSGIKKSTNGSTWDSL